MQELLRSRTASAFNHQDWLITRCATGRRDKAAGITEVFEIEQNSAGFTVASEEVKQVINVNVQAIAQRNKVRKPHFTLLSPVQDGIGDRRRLRNKRQFTSMYRHRRKAGVKTLPRRKQAQTIWAEQPHLIAGGTFQQSGILFGYRREDDAGFAPFLPQRFQQLKVSAGVGAKHGEIGREGQAIDVRPGQYALNRFPRWRNGEDGAVKPASQQVAHHQITGALWFH